MKQNLLHTGLLGLALLLGGASMGTGRSRSALLLKDTAASAKPAQLAGEGQLFG